MNECCVDASVAVKWAIKEEPFREEACAFLRQLGAKGVSLIAPPLFINEVDSVIRKYVFSGRMAADEAQKAYTILDNAPVEIIFLEGVRQRARDIAEQFNQQFVYDATYAALADLRACEFWTADKVFYNAVKARLPFVKYLAAYQIKS